MNNKIKYFFLIFLTHLVYSTCIAQQKEPKLTFNTVNFRIKHSKKIPYNEFSVSFKNNTFKRDEGVLVYVKSKPSRDEKKWEYSRIDTSYVIKKEVFYKISDSISSLNFKDVLPKLGGFAIDGYDCTLEFGGFNNKMSVKINSPDSLGDSMIPFYDICKIIIESVGYKAEEILN